MGLFLWRNNEQPFDILIWNNAYWWAVIYFIQVIIVIREYGHRAGCGNAAHASLKLDA